MKSENLLTRDDTILGICQGLGVDLGFNPLWLRLAFGIGVLVSPTAVIGTYLGLGVIVLLARLIFPAPVTAAVEAQMPEPAAQAVEVAPAPALAREPERLAA
jgi:phage shock protein PspC (stress-responsive transcriptional regulator)